MDSARYLDLFLAESRERVSRALALQTLLEDSPAERRSIGEMLRHAHSLKGMAATMGYAPMVELAHAIEDMLARLQADPKGDVAGALPLVGDALGCFDEMLDRIESEGRPDSTRAAHLGDKLRARAGATAPPPVTVAEPRGGVAAVPCSPAPLSGAVPWRLVLRLDDDPALSVRSTTAVLAEAARVGSVMQVDPPRMSLATGRFSGELGLLLSCAFDAATIEERLRQIPGVREVAVESVPPLGPLEQPAGGVSWIRVRADRMDAIADELAELRKSHGRLQSALAGGPHRPLLDQSASRIKKIYGAVLDLRLVPFETVVQRLRQTVRELAPQLGKLVRVEIEGAELHVDRDVLDELVDPLLHLVRNAVDHGIEMPEERHAAGKPAAGTLRLTLRQSGERVDLRLADDGRGIDTGAVREQAVARGLVEARHVATLDEGQAMRLVTLPGLSTAERVSHISGRGIGLDVVQDTVERLGGRLELESARGRGTEVRLLVPSRQALLSALLVRSSGVLFALPVARVRRAVAASDVASRPRTCTPSRLESRRSVVPAPGATAPLDGTWVILLEDESQGIVVDEILGPRDLVVHPLPPPLNLLRRYAGAAVLEDGSIALVPDLSTP